MLKRNDKVGINLHGEENDMTVEKREIIMSAWRKYFMIRLRNWINLNNSFTTYTKLVSTIRSSQILCMLMKQKKISMLV